MVVTPMWKIKFLLFLGKAETWLQNFFSTPRQRRARYRHAVDSEAFECWMNGGARFEAHIKGHFAVAERSGHQGNIQFWRDVLESAKSFDAYPENRRKRDEMTFYHQNEDTAAAA